MAVTVSKAEALMEMVKAFEENDIKRANKIGSIVSKSILSDSQKQGYSAYIDLDRDTKQFFPVKIRKSANDRNRKVNTETIKIKVGNEVYGIKISNEIEIISVKEH